MKKKCMYFYLTDVLFENIFIVSLIPFCSRFPDVPDPPPNRPMVLSADSRTVNLSWAPPRKVHNHPVTAYKIFIK